MFISPEDMNEHIRAGRAEPWTSPLGSDQEVLPAVRMNDIWYVMFDGTFDYQPAPQELNDLLTEGLNDLNALDAQIAAATAGIDKTGNSTGHYEADQATGPS